MQKQNSERGQAGFSLFELIIAMTITLVLTGLASKLLAGSFAMRARENQKTEALADAQRGLNVMTREIANSGYGLTDNGIVAADTGLTSIRVRANLNAASGETTSNSTSDRDEDIKYLLWSDPDNINSFIVRLDVNSSAQEMILANRVDSMKLRYYADKVTYDTGDCAINNGDITNVRDEYGNPAGEVALKAAAKYIVLSICVNLPAVSTPGAPGYQPSSSVHLVSDIALRNSQLYNY
ncbi:MAG TPA: prepilin-type N-terminal cleavage/methylation domain-containing protein [Pyrinomonadaceae bacterium]|nr:prepilin-type N-terminal cleavage/methylation domain-containing protein [Pyrinomonadaceae bacterium]